MTEIRTSIPLEDRIDEVAPRWAPHAGPQRDFLSRREAEAGYGGAKGGGKSDAVLYGGLRQVGHPWYHAAQFRRTLPEAQEMIDRAAAYFPHLGAEWNEQKKRWTFPSDASGPGARMSFFYLEREQDASRHNGKEYHYLGFDQLETMTETMYTSLIGCARASHRGLYVRIRSSFNPGGPGHLFVKKRFVNLGPRRSYIDPETGLSRVFVPATVWDNPAIIQNDPSYIQRLLGISDPALRAAYLEGKWDVFAGQFFSTWDERIHTCDPFEPPEWWRRTGGMDYGGNAAPSVVYFNAHDDHGRPWAYKELTLEGETSRGIGDRIAGAVTCDAENTMVIKADPSLWTKNPELGGQSIAERINERLQERGCGIVLTAANNDRLNGWARVQDLLDPRRPDPENERRQRPWLTVMRSDGVGTLGCPRLIETLPAQIHDPKKIGDLLKGPTDHWCDAFRYDAIDYDELSPIPLEHLRPKPHGRRITEHTRRAYLRAMAQQNRELLQAEEAMAEGEMPVGIVDPFLEEARVDEDDVLDSVTDLWT